MVADRVEQGLPGGVDDVVARAHRAPDAGAMAALDEDLGAGIGVVAAVKYEQK